MEYLLNVLEDGHVTVDQTDPIGRLFPPSFDPHTGVEIKDVKISSEVSARVFLPHGACVTPSCFKFPLLLYIHGGGFFTESPFSMLYTRYVIRLANEANVMVVSVDYGLFPKRPIPACYEDSWAALQWIALHAEGYGPETWINNYADLKRIFVIGDSAGGNVSHNLLARVGSIGLRKGVKIEGMILVHPFFGQGSIDDEVWMCMCPTNAGPWDHRMKPSESDLVGIGCGRVLVLVAEDDYLRDGGKGYVDELIKSGWEGRVDIVKNQKRTHCFHIFNFHDSEAVANMQRIISFIYGFC
ncbi:probable carboxylesterase 4, mitochondrial [Amaranthus tricolor]|uniref:probable carboxylesterase 4, mitochondrial n=1 Tax=Amaranthus tricolor TaxID=29722 RepID=UPI00258ECC8A|nr:probable carboxylesterase 4, mitochondrial [Amaranthus tricolor]